MTPLAQRLHARYYADAVHPYRQYERSVEALLKPSDVLMDAGCGRTVPVLRKFVGKARRLIGVEIVEFTDVPPPIEAYNADLARLPLEPDSVDLIMSRSVFEHLQDPRSVYREFHRILRPGGKVVFLTANLWDYGTMVARLVPNRFHAAIVRKVEGREEEDTFPTEYKTNTRREVEALSADAGLRVVQFDYLNQYPNYLGFNGFLFFLGIGFERLTSRFHALRFLRGWILVTLEKSVGPGGNGR